jgi:tritrans,polycis-undecaprenyl-diphosphate synthase [geranylgeranyl-diphosphate specific]
MTIDNVDLNPKHVGIILDGNRRYAKKLARKPWEGHSSGADKVKKLIEWALELNLKELSLYAFSLENFKRSEDEVKFLMKVFKNAFDDLMSEENQKKLINNGIKINFCGRIEMFPAEVLESMKKLMDFTKNNSNFIVNFAMAYDGRAEILDATKKIANLIKENKLQPDEINDELFAKQLYIPENLDLLIRTSGEQRISGFMLWQNSYAEFFFCSKMWPEFEKEDFIKCIEEFNKRERRFGR